MTRHTHTRSEGDAIMSCRNIYCNAGDHPGVSCYWAAQGKTPADKRPGGKTFKCSDGSLLCDECCNGDRCDDPTHFDRKSCPYCLGSGKPPAPSEPAPAEPAAPAELRPWICFHCGFETNDEREAAAHFGDRDEEMALCQTWARLSADERAAEYQSTIRELNAERDENSRLRTQVDGLEFRVEGQLSEIKSFKPFRACDSIQQIFNIYDSMEGRALAAEERIASLESERSKDSERLDKLERNRMVICCFTLDAPAMFIPDREDGSPVLAAQGKTIREVIDALPEPPRPAIK